ncbi:MAG: AbrB family transcriptional regulator [Thiothrix lacustris]|uniref:AbrB family transcriptional regulator n=1 Tax=Thiothrix lacustris TaxID=525917 RepID=A0A1Y1QG84_9GAMM|nr:MAG: AbrB family transcriptional regulator [Thiothrix lacustris]
MSSIAIQVSQGGRIVIPAEIRQKMGISIGDQVLLTWREDSHELNIATRKQRLQSARKLVQQHVKAGNSVVDKLIQERRQAAANE